MNFKVAILQSRSEQGRLLENTERVISYMKEAAGEQADILLLPECFLTGYVMPITNEEANLLG